MRLTKGLRISLCCFVVVSVGMVLMFQGSVWAKDKGRIVDILKSKSAIGRPTLGKSALTKGKVGINKPALIKPVLAKPLAPKMTKAASLSAIKAPKTPTIKGLPGQIDVKLKK